MLIKKIQKLEIKPLFKSAIYTSYIGIFISVVSSTPFLSKVFVLIRCCTNISAIFLSNASELERKFFQIFLKKKSEVVQGIEKDLRELSTKYNELGIENQEYQSFIIDNLNIINNKNNNEE